MTAPAAPESFDDLAGEYLAEYLAQDPVRASTLGATEHDARLPDLSAGALAQAARRDAQWRERLAAPADGALDDEQRLDRDLLAMWLRKREIVREDWADWRRYPDLYSAPVLHGVFVLFLYRLRPEGELVDAAVARLEAAGDLLASGRANLDPELAAPSLVRRALGQVRAGEHYLRDLLAGDVADGDGRRRLQEAGARAADAFGEYASFLDDLAQRAGGDYAIGEQRYSQLLREAEGLDYGAPELHERGRRAYEELDAELRDLAQRVAGDPDWAGVAVRLDEEHPATPEQMRDAYAEWTERARRFCAERELVTLAPGEHCAVEPSPAFQRPVLAVAFYMAPPALSDRRSGTFFVPYPADGTPAEQVRQRLANNSYVTIPTTAVHEAYPGHHWHLSWLAQSCRRPLRKVLTTSYFSEGWALYAEQMLRDNGLYDDPRHEFGQVSARIFRAARIVVDTALHSGEMTVDEAVAFMTDKGTLTPETARAEVARYCAWPTQASSYLTGAMEIQRMAEQWPHSLREFHDTLAASGALPLVLAERALRLAAARRSS